MRDCKGQGNWNRLEETAAYHFGVLSKVFQLAIANSANVQGQLSLPALGGSGNDIAVHSHEEQLRLWQHLTGKHYDLCLSNGRLALC